MSKPDGSETLPATEAPTDIPAATGPHLFTVDEESKQFKMTFTSRGNSMDTSQQHARAVFKVASDFSKWLASSDPNEMTMTRGKELSENEFDWGETTHFFGTTFDRYPTLSLKVIGGVFYSNGGAFVELVWDTEQWTTAADAEVRRVYPSTNVR